MSYGDMDDREKVLFHTTERADAATILAEGFSASFASLGEAVYLYGSLASAQAFARQRSYRTFDDPVVIAVRDGRPRKVDAADLDALQDPRVYVDVWMVGLDEDAGEERFVPQSAWIADSSPRARRPMQESLAEPASPSAAARVP
jgi:hypothetical protein